MPQKPKANTNSRLYPFQPTALPPIEEFSPKNFMDQVPDTDSSGNKIPDWKRQMKAKNLAQKAQQEYMEKKQVCGWMVVRMSVSAGWL